MRLSAKDSPIKIETFEISLKRRSKRLKPLDPNKRIRIIRPNDDLEKLFGVITDEEDFADVIYLKYDENSDFSNESSSPDFSDVPGTDDVVPITSNTVLIPAVKCKVSKEKALHCASKLHPSKKCKSGGRERWRDCGSVNDVCSEGLTHNYTLSNVPSSYYDEYDLDSEDELFLSKLGQVNSNKLDSGNKLREKSKKQKIREELQSNKPKLVLNANILSKMMSVLEHELQSSKRTACWLSDVHSQRRQNMEDLNSLPLQLSEIRRKHGLIAAQSDSQKKLLKTLADIKECKMFLNDMSGDLSSDLTHPIVDASLPTSLTEDFIKKLVGRKRALLLLSIVLRESFPDAGPASTSPGTARTGLLHSSAESRLLGHVYNHWLRRRSESHYSPLRCFQRFPTADDSSSSVPVLPLVHEGEDDLRIQSDVSALSRVKDELIFHRSELCQIRSLIAMKNEECTAASLGKRDTAVVKNVTDNLGLGSTTSLLSRVLHSFLA